MNELSKVLVKTGLLTQAVAIVALDRSSLQTDVFLSVQRMNRTAEDAMLAQQVLVTLSRELCKQSVDAIVWLEMMLSEARKQGKLTFKIEKDCSAYLERFLHQQERRFANTADRINSRF